MSMRVLKWFCPVFTVRNVLVWACGAVIGGGIMVAVSRLGRPVTIIETRETTGMAVRGGRLNVFTKLTKARECDTTTAHYLERYVPHPNDPAEIVPMRVPLIGPIVPLAALGQQDYVLSLALPSDLEAGKWDYRWKSSMECGPLAALLGPTIIYGPAVPIDLLPAEGAAREVLQPGTVLRPDLRP